MSAKCVCVPGVRLACGRSEHLRTAIVPGAAADRFPVRFRKGGLLMNDVIGILGAALMGFSSMAESYELLIVGRLVIGYNCGESRLRVRGRVPVSGCG